MTSNSIQEEYDYVSYLHFVETLRKKTFGKLLDNFCVSPIALNYPLKSLRKTTYYFLVSSVAVLSYTHFDLSCNKPQKVYYNLGMCIHSQKKRC